MEGNKKYGLIILFLIIIIIALVKSDNPLHIDNLFAVTIKDAVAKTSYNRNLLSDKVSVTFNTDDVSLDGSKKGQQYHITESGTIEALRLTEDRSSWHLGKIHPEVLDNASAQEEIPVIIHLKGKPVHKISQNVKVKRLPEIRVLSKKVRNIYSEHRPKGRFEHCEDEKIAMGKKRLSIDQLEEVKSLNHKIDALLDKMRKDIAGEAKKAVNKEQDKIKEFVRQLNGKITGITQV